MPKTKICERCGKELKQTDMYQRDASSDYWCAICADRALAEFKGLMEEKERVRQLAVEYSLLADGYKQSLEFCKNMKLAKEFEELLETTSIPVAVEKLKGLVTQLAEAQADNAVVLGKLNAVQDYFSNPQKYDGAWKEWHSATIKQLMSKKQSGSALLQEVEQLRKRNTELEAINKSMLEFGMDGRCPVGVVCSDGRKDHDTCRKCWAEYFQRQALAQAKAGE